MGKVCFSFFIFIHVLITGHAQFNDREISEKSERIDSILTLEQQLELLVSHSEILRYRRLREEKADDPYRPLYHFSTPEGALNDPNGFTFWNGYYHLFYQLWGIGRGGMEWAHAYSKDLVHWKDLPMAIKIDSGQIYSGQALAEDNRVIAMYHNTAGGNYLAIGNDPLLLQMKKYSKKPVIAEGIVSGEGFQPPFDPNIWKQNDGYYYSISGTKKNGKLGVDGFPVTDLFRSKDLLQWEYIGLLIEDEDWVNMGLGPGNDAAVPNFHPIQTRNKTEEVINNEQEYWMFNFFSHGHGGRALIGVYDSKKVRFHPKKFYQMNFGPVYKGTLHAPSAFVDSIGRLIVIYNIRESLTTAREAISSQSGKLWYGIMSLVRHYWLSEDGNLRMEPVGDYQSLRYDHKKITNINLNKDEEIVLENFSGNSLEIRAVINPMQAERVGIEVLRSPDGVETTLIIYDPKEKTITLDVSHGSNHDKVPLREPEKGPLVLKNDELLELQIFIDRSVVEVFANKQQCLIARVYPIGKNSNTISIFSKGGKAKLQSLNAWKMKSIWEDLE
ncbi:glycoside hydrolase family 32 protein [Arenibacter latericius]|uniref:glycoside hydrolase family 32 protein n=1 Tax=Arenibacter latericius TaxID=86104 RepID=UPI000420C841|nr:glycoside hydrolase family 32 protein [Arenibacter latericius]